MDQIFRAKTLIKIAQQELTKEDVSTNIDDALHSNSFLNWLEERVQPIIEKSLEKLFLINKDKMQEYIQNPQKIEEDFNSMFNIIDYVDYILDALTIASIAGALFSGGTSLLGAVAGLSGKVIFKLALKFGLKEIIKKIVKRMILRIGPKVLTKLSKGLIKNYSTALIKELTFRIKILIFLETLTLFIETGKIVGIESIKKIVKERSIELGLSNNFTNEILSPNTNPQLIKKIIDKEKELVLSFINSTLSAQGITQVGLGAALRMTGLNRAALIEREKNKLQALSSNLPQNNLTQVDRFKSKIENNSNSKLQESRVEVSNFDKLFKQSRLPMSLRSDYERMEKEYLGKYGEEGKKLFEDKIESASSFVGPIVETIKELSTINFIKQNESLFIKRKDILDELLDDVSNISIQSPKDLMKERGGTLNKVLTSFKEEKKQTLLKLLEQITNKKVDEDLFLKLQSDIFKSYNLSQYFNKISEKLRGLQ